jgi:hypothetical protein
VGRIVNRKCDEPLAAYVVGTSVISLLRIAMAFQMCGRMILRPWDNQTFVEAMGEVWNNAEGQDHPKDLIFTGYSLNMGTMIVNFADWVWWWFGFVAICSSDPMICSDRASETAWVLVSYQFFNVHFPSFILDIVIPYYSMEVLNHTLLLHGGA